MKMYKYIIQQGEVWEDPNAITMQVWISGEEYQKPNVLTEDKLNMYILA